MPLLIFLFPLVSASGLALVLAALVRRNRISRTVGCWSTAASFACAGAYLLWRVEWFDVWRHGVPSLSYLIGYVPYIIAFAATGWLVALVSTRKIRTPPRGALRISD